MRRALRQIKQANDRRAKAIVAHPEVQFMLTTLMEIHRARKANDSLTVERMLVQVDSYCEGIAAEAQKPLP